MATVTIRAIQDKDKTEWLGLWDQYNTFYKRTVSEKITNKTYERFLDDKYRMYAAVAVSSDDKIVGFAHWYPHVSTSEIEEVVYLHDLFVDPSVRNGGVGRKLIEHVKDYAKGLPAAQLYWHTQVSILSSRWLEVLLLTSGSTSTTELSCCIPRWQTGPIS